ncbi:MAG: hypothetical protein AAF696_00100 [Bacteroidota bacterium]
MKITTIILSLYVFFLASLPALSVVEVFHEVICCIGDHDEHQEDENDDCAEACNPFLSCHCSPGFTTVVSDHIYRLQAYELNTRIKHLSSSPLVFSVWHPPRV